MTPTPIAWLLPQTKIIVDISDFCLKLIAARAIRTIRISDFIPMVIDRFESRLEDVGNVYFHLVIFLSDMSGEAGDEIS